MRLDIPCSPDLADVVAALALAATGRGASVVRHVGGTIVQAYVTVAEAEACRSKLLAQLERAGPPLGAIATRIQLTPLPDADWCSAWREHFKPLRIGNRLVIKPSWESWPPPDNPSAAGPGDLVIELDPGGAFGTGAHATTQLALLALERWMGAGHTVVDVGCGSGILSLAALALGAGLVVAIDNDWAAIEFAAANLGNCPQSAKARLLVGDGLSAVHLTPHIIIANISAEAAVAIGVQASSLLRPGGLYIATGFLSEAADDVVQSLADVALQVEEAEELEGWHCLVFSLGRER